MSFSGTLLLFITVLVTQVLGKMITIQENFDASCNTLQNHQDTANWELPIWQWGGDINGGVSPKNVNTTINRGVKADFLSLQPFDRV